MTFNIDLHGITAKECFAEASREELRVLLALISLGGSFATEEELARAAGVSAARCRAALVLFTESGVIAETDGDVIIDEFCERRDTSSRYEKPTGEVARSVRDADMADFLEECATMLGKPTLSTEEIKDLEYALTDLGVSKEYVLLLLAHLIGRRKTVTVRILVKRIEELVKKHIDTAEALEAHIREVEKTTADEWEFKNRFNYYRTLSDVEKKYIAKWFGEFGFSIEIIFAAYGAATKTVSPNIPFSRIDRILTAWHEAGCKTVAECLSKGEEHREAMRAEEKAKRDAELAAASGTAKPTGGTPNKTAKYNNFDTEDALMAALKRSYGDPAEDGE